MHREVDPEVVMMGFREIWQAVRYHGLILLPAMMLGALAGIISVEVSDPSYRARADVFVTASSDGSVTETAEAASYSKAQAINFAELATRQVVLLLAIVELDLPLSSAQLRGQISATVPLNTSIITITATDASAERSALIANAVATSLTEAVDELTPTTSSGRTPLSLVRIEEATTPSAPVSPRPLLNVVIGILLGLFLGVAAIAVRDALLPPDHEALVRDDRTNHTDHTDREESSSLGSRSTTRTA